MTDSTLGLLGLARRGGNLALGEEPVAEACRSGRAKLVLLADDAGPSTVRRANRLAQEGKVELIHLPYAKSELGQCLGRSSCALLAPTDLGLAAALVRGLARREESLGVLAHALEEKQGRRKERRPNGKRRKARGSQTPVDLEV